MWQLYEAVEPGNVIGYGGDNLADLVSIVRHTIHPDIALSPLSDTVENNFQKWLLKKEKAGERFTNEQMTWLIAIKNHISTSLNIEEDDFYDIPFSQMGGLGKFHQVFGERVPKIMKEMNRRLVA